MSKIRKKINNDLNMNFNLKLITLIFAMAVSYNCGKSIPVEEMGNAKYLISKAESVKADKYAPEKYDQAKKLLLEAHDLIADGSMGDAKDKALAAQKAAQEAFDIAIPLLAKGSRESAEQAIKEAERLFASEFAKEEFKNSNDFLAEGKKLESNNQYEDAFKKFEQAGQEAGKARDIAESQIVNMKSSIAESKNALDQAKEYGAESTHPDKFREASELVADAQAKIDANDLKAAYPKSEKAKELSQELLSLALESWAGKLYKQAKEYVGKINAKLDRFRAKINKNRKLKALVDKNDELRETLNSTQTSMNAAKEAVTNAKESLDSKAFQDSKKQSEEAKRLAEIVDKQLPQIAVLISEQTGIQFVAGASVSARNPLGEGWQTYKVKNRPGRRDCLWRIAGYDYIYKNPRLWPRIYKANQSKIKNPDLIYPGQVFDIPPKEEGASQSKLKNQGQKNYTVKEKSVEASDEGLGVE